MDRRAFIASGVAAVAAPLAAAARATGVMYRIGMLSPELPPPGLVEGFQERLQELGYTAGTYVLDSRNAAGNLQRLATLAEDLVRAKVDVIVAVNTPAALAAKRATTTIPIVITRVGDPVKNGLVSSMSQPGGNITGITFLPDELSGKRLQLLKDAIPGITRVAAVWSGNNTGSELSVIAMQAASAHLGLKLVRIPIVSPGDLPGAVQAAVRNPAEALIVVDEAFIADRVAIPARGRSGRPHRVWAKHVSPISTDDVAPHADLCVQVGVRAAKDMTTVASLRV